ncbi:MAG: hypothetical protein ACRDK9_08340 [Solirubrobacterales bacterium]
MRRKLTIAVAGFTVAGLGGFAALGLAGGGGGTPAATQLVNGYESPGVSVHRVAEPSAGARVTAFRAKGKRKQVRIAYFETDPFPIVDSTAVGDSLACRGNRRVLGGYFGSDGVDVALTFSAPESSKRWFVGLTNLPDTVELDPPNRATQAFTGIVCAKGVK